MQRSFFPRRTMEILAIGLLVALHAGSGLADDELAKSGPRGEFADLIEVSEVLLDVLVTDGDGNVVLGLGPDDFIIEEEGVQRQASSVSFYSNRFQIRDGEEGRVQKPAPNEVLADRFLILFFHDPKAFGASNRAQLVRQHLEATRRAREWVAKDMLPGDWVAVVSYDYKLKVHLDFTQSRSAIEQAIQQAARSRDPQNQWESRREEVEEGRPTLLASLPSGDALRDQTTRIYDALRLLAESTRGIVGRKSMLLFTLGFGEVRRGGAFGAEPDSRYYPQLRQALNDNNVAIYPINLLHESAGFNLQGHFLNQLASDTGGSYYESFVNFITPIRKIADENNGYYLLSYQAEHPSGESGYREVAVRTKNPELEVRTRTGYRFGS